MKKVLFFSFFLAYALLVQSQVRVNHLLVENLSNPVGLDVTSPRFTWQLATDKRNVMQGAYEIRVGTTPGSLTRGKGVYWSSGKINSDSSVHVVYKGKPLGAGNKYYWQVRIWDNERKSSPWSEIAYWQMGLLNPDDWKAKWIGPGFAEDSVLRPAVHLRKEFATTKKIQSATAFITAHGLYEAVINGKRVSDAYLAPGWTSYNKRLQYQVFDVTGHLKQGRNAIGVTLGNGWYRGHLAWGGNKNIWGKDISLLLQVDINYSDGSKESIVSDNSWKSATGSIVFSEIYDGEIIDARKEKVGWLNAGYNDADWKSVSVMNHNKSVLVATENEMIRKQESFKPLKVLTTPKGEKVIDFGQNVVGWVTVKLKGSAGDTVTISHAEVLDKQGNFYTDNLRAAKAQAVYILKGDDEETFEPHFTFFGFRYIKVEGVSGEIEPANFTAVALYSDMEPSGSFTCSNPLVNQLQHNIQWGQKGNFLDVPTDCPQRDERLGWTGDAQAFFRTAAFNMHVNNFFAKWMKDVAADQLPSGSVPFVIPNVLGQSAGSTGWADAATIIPWNMYLLYGDKRVLEQQYPSMKAWVAYMTRNSRNDLWNQGFHFGDWLFYRPFDDNDGRSAVTDKYLIAQSFYAHSTQLVINTAKVLGKREDVNTYTALLKRIKDAYMKEYVTPNGRLVSGTQTAYILALNFDMLPDSMQAPAANRLVENIKSYGTQLTTGFLGTPYLCHVLTRFGHDTLAYKLLLRQSYPSWLYPVKMGATTIWERWDGIKPDSTFQTPTMNSFNHYAYGAIGDWMYRVIAGINTDEEAPGYKKSIIKPHLTDSLSFAFASLQTYYGKLSSEWRKEKNKFVLNVEIPANTTATIFIPARKEDDVLESGKKIAASSVEKESGFAKVNVGSGKYSFSVEDKNL